MNPSRNAVPVRHTTKSESQPASIPEQRILKCFMGWGVTECVESGPKMDPEVWSESPADDS